MFLMWIIPVLLGVLAVIAFSVDQLNPAPARVTSSVCRRCGAPVEAGRTTCPHCGQQL